MAFAYCRKVGGIRTPWKAHCLNVFKPLSRPWGWTHSPCDLLRSVSLLRAIGEVGSADWSLRLSQLKKMWSFGPWLEGLCRFRDNSCHMWNTCLLILMADVCIILGKAWRVASYKWGNTVPSQRTTFLLQGNERVLTAPEGYRCLIARFPKSIPRGKKHC